MVDSLILEDRKFRSRLLVGTGKFSSGRTMEKAIEATGAKVVTVALRRVEPDNPEDHLLNALTPAGIPSCPTLQAPETPAKR